MISQEKRSHFCGLLSEEDIGKRAIVMGWVQRVRDMGGVLFVDLRDKTGLLQLVFNIEKTGEEIFALAESLRSEFVVKVDGLIEQRDEETYNPKIPTGKVELRAEALEILSKSKTIPFPIEDDINVNEEIRFTHRYLDLRRPKLYNNLALRHNTSKFIRRYLDDNGFMEVETPILTKSTPEGARDYLVPSRIHEGKFYALPQSPQIFKQLLMVSGIDRYYQVARCFRDEDLRADRQPEFTQVDIEMSFVDQEDVLSYLESMFKKVFSQVMNIDFNEPFPRLTYQEAMDLYGSDKPDIRFDMKIVELSHIAKDCGFKVFKNAVDKGGAVRALNIKGGNSFTRNEIDELTKFAINNGSQGMAWIAIEENGNLRTILDKFLSPNEVKEIIETTKAEAGDLIIFSADKLDIVYKTLGNLRLFIGDKLGLRKKDDYKFLIVTDFPLLEWSEEEGRYIAMHHPFTMPAHVDKFLKGEGLDTMNAKSYDFVLNGIELGSGSIRIHRDDLQKKMFEVLGLSQKDIEERFGFIIEAFSYGTPPHGGFAFGLDRLVMIMSGSDTIRDVIAFPKTRDASCLLSNAPSHVDQDQLDILGLSLGGALANHMDKENKVKKATYNMDDLEDLSQFILREEEKKEINKEMQGFLQEISALDSLDTSKIEATINVYPLPNSTREDMVKESFSNEALLANAPTVEDGYILVPRVID